MEDTKVELKKVKSNRNYFFLVLEVIVRKGGVKGKSSPAAFFL